MGACFLRHGRRFTRRMPLVKPDRRPALPPGAAIPAAFAAACAVWMGIGALPRSVPPEPPPPFYELPAEARAQEARDRVLRSRVPRTEVAAELDDAFRRFGATSVARGGERLAAESQQQLARLATELERRSGSRALRALRAEHAWRWVEALEDRSAAARAVRLELGGDLSSVLERGGLLVPGAVRGTHELAADRAVLAVFAKARWNVTASRPRTEGLSVFELRVFHGYRATRLRGVRIATRLEALEQLAPIAGRYPVHEALGALRYRAGEFDRSMAEFLAAMEDGMMFRVRNHLRAAAEQAGPPPPEGR